MDTGQNNNSVNEKAKVCLTCGLDMIRRVDKDTFQCDYSRCGKIFDRSTFSESEMKYTPGPQTGK